MCTRWLHEDCIDYDIVIGSDGKELLCPYYVIKFITLELHDIHDFFCMEHESSWYSM